MIENGFSKIESVFADEQTLIFNGFSTADLKPFVEVSSIKNFNVGKLIYDVTNANEIPLIIIMKGCVGVIDKSDERGELDDVIALVMPYQLLGEFQLLNDEFPDNIELLSFAETQIIEIKRECLNYLSDETRAKFYCNLAKTLVEKINCANRHLAIRGISTVSVKLIEYLTEVRKHTIWQRAVTIDENALYDLNIIWSVNKLASYLSCKEIGIAEALFDLVEIKAMEIVWFDRDFKPINDVTPDMVKKLNKQRNPLKYRTKFKINNIDRVKLRETLENL